MVVMDNLKWSQNLMWIPVFWYDIETSIIKNPNYKENNLAN
jgi:hypothetical protein